jgi:protein-L-isoaspartate(D-aspartate) O-methyltransferase
MTEALHLSKTDRVLEIGTGSGYQSAILAELCQHLYTIEILEPLGKRAKKILNDLGYKNITIKIGDGYQGWEEYAPYDAVIVTCAPSHVPAPLKDQLKEGGRMIIPVGEGFDQELIFLQKKNQALKQTKTLPVLFVPMVDETGRKH